MQTLAQNKFIRVIVPVFAVLFFLSCQKDINDNIQNQGQTADLTTKVNSSVSGFVTDENDVAILGASVNVGGSLTTTDKYGFFQIKNVQVVKNAAMVTVNQPGYFKGIKTYIATENKAAFFRIKLIPKTNVGIINAVSGGNVTLSNGLIVALPANAVVTAGSGAAYTGSVNVAAHWIDPTAADLNLTMPGDLRGLATDGSLKTLTTYGMAAVELTGASGELLQIAAGKKATLTMSIPASILATAPATIPLWSFDETTGLWKQEGTATKSGNTYVGEVSHFSFWNCDVPNNYVQFDCTVKDQSGNPVPYVWVKIGISGTTNFRWGITDSSGYVRGVVPDNALLTLDIYSYYYCGQPLYSQTFSTTSSNISLGIITINISLGMASLSGTVTNCSSAPVTNGYIIMMNNNWYYRYAISNTGTFSFNTALCSSTSTNVTLIAEDITGGQQSNPFNHTLVMGPNVVGNLQACGITTQEFFTYSIDGGTTSTTLTAPADSIIHGGNSGTTQASIYGLAGGSTNNFVNFSFSTSGIGVGSSQTLLSYYSTQTGQGVASGTVNITEYGAVGQFIAGNYTGTLVGTVTYNLVGNFRVRRSF